MKRPAFQFYPKDWRNNAKLRRCSRAARGIWMDVLCLLHDSEEEYGVLRWPLKDIAQAADAPLSLLRELADKGVLKGADKGAEPYIFRPSHAGKLGEPVTLVATESGPCWWCSRFVRDEWIRQRRGAATRFDADNQPPKAPPNNRPNDSPTRRIGDESGDGPPSASPTAFSSVPTASNEASGTGGEPPKPRVTDPDEIIFGYGVPLLVTAGTEEKHARSFLGKLRKVHGDEAVIDSLRQCLRAKPLQPLEWLAAALPPKGGAGTNRQEALEQRNRQIAQDWADATEEVQL